MEQEFIIGIIGMGDMGRLYAHSFTAAGYPVIACDLPSKTAGLMAEFAGSPIQIVERGEELSNRANFILYSVEAEYIGEVVEKYGPHTRPGAIVGGQTSVKHPEILAFEKYLPPETEIVSMHALHGPGFKPTGQKVVLVPHRNSAASYACIKNIFLAIGSDLVEMKDYHEHDRVVADTQAVTHVGFEGMGTAWKQAGFFPWENASYVGGIDNVKILITLRIFSYKAHVYAGLALLNPYAGEQVRQYAKSESELFKLMIMEDETAFRNRLQRARAFVFHESNKPLLLDDSIMREFSLSESEHTHKANSHLSLLSMVDAWYHLGINPYDNLVCQTPPFRLRLGIAEYLFRNEELLEESILTALYDKSIRADDLEFHTAVREWSSIISYGDMEAYKQHFDEVKSFFSSRLDEGRRQSAELIRRLSLD